MAAQARQIQVTGPSAIGAGTAITQAQRLGQVPGHLFPPGAVRPADHPYGLFAPIHRARTSDGARVSRATRSRIIVIVSRVQALNLVPRPASASIGSSSSASPRSLSASAPASLARANVVTRRPSRTTATGSPAEAGGRSSSSGTGRAAAPGCAAYVMSGSSQATDRINSSSGKSRASRLADAVKLGAQPWITGPVDLLREPGHPGQPSGGPADVTRPLEQVEQCDQGALLRRAVPDVEGPVGPEGG